MTKKSTAKPSTKAAATKRAPAKREAADVTLVQMAVAHDRDPKLVRAKARRYEDELKPFMTDKGRWTFKGAAQAKVEAILFKG
jgi:hypothetical protein